MIVHVPAPRPVINPNVGTIAAISVLLLAHVPPAVASPNVVFPPTQTSGVPVMAVGLGYTVIPVVV